MKPFQYAPLVSDPTFARATEREKTPVDVSRVLEDGWEPPSGRASRGDARKNHHPSAVVRNGMTGAQPPTDTPCYWTRWRAGPWPLPTLLKTSHPTPASRSLVIDERTHRATRLCQPLRFGHGSGRISAHRRRLPRPDCTQRCVRTTPPPNGCPDEPPRPWVLRRAMA